MKGDELLFELRAPGGEVYRLYLDGRAEGFPDGTAVQNLAFPLWCALVGEVKGQGVGAVAKVDAVPGVHGLSFR